MSKFAILGEEGDVTRCRGRGEGGVTIGGTTYNQVGLGALGAHARVAPTRAQSRLVSPSLARRRPVVMGECGVCRGDGGGA